MTDAEVKHKSDQLTEGYFSISRHCPKICELSRLEGAQRFCFLNSLFKIKILDKRLYYCFILFNNSIITGMKHGDTFQWIYVTNPGLNPILRAVYWSFAISWTVRSKYHFSKAFEIENRTKQLQIQKKKLFLGKIYTFFVTSIRTCNACVVPFQFNFTKWPMLNHGLAFKNFFNKDVLIAGGVFSRVFRGCFFGMH